MRIGAARPSCRSDCSTLPTVTFKSYGRFSNHLIQLANVLFWAEANRRTLVVPTFLESLDAFSLDAFECAYCMRFATVKNQPADLVINGSKAYYMYHNRRGLLPRLVDFTEKHAFTVRLYASLFSSPREELLRSIGCALDGVHRHAGGRAACGARALKRARKGWFQAAPAALGDFAAVHVRKMQSAFDIVRGAKGECERRIEEFNRSAEFCRMPPDFVRRQMRRAPTCHRTQRLYVATKKPEDAAPLMHAMNATVGAGGSSSLSRKARESLALWTDLCMLALSSCVLLNPVSTFTHTVGYLKLAWGRSTGEVLHTRAPLMNATLNWY